MGGLDSDTIDGQFGAGLAAVAGLEGEGDGEFSFAQQVFDGGGHVGVIKVRAVDLLEDDLRVGLVARADGETAENVFQAEVNAGQEAELGRKNRALRPG